MEKVGRSYLLPGIWKPLAPPRSIRERRLFSFYDIKERRRYFAPRRYVRTARTESDVVSTPRTLAVS
jgi:hypothetical protein